MMAPAAMSQHFLCVTTMRINKESGESSQKTCLLSVFALKGRYIWHVCSRFASHGDEHDVN
jgi:hypothetical protein